MAAIGVPEEEQPKPDAKAKSPAEKPDPATKTKTAPGGYGGGDFERDQAAPLHTNTQAGRSNLPSFGLQKENNSTYSSSRAKR